MSQLAIQSSEFEERSTYFAEVILPLPVEGTFTYRVPHEMTDVIQPGFRVVVQFGRKKILTGIVADIHQNPPEKYEAKYIMDLIDEQPIVTSYQLKLFYWMTSYYMSHLGDVLNAAVPTGLRLSSESYIQLHPDFDVSQDHKLHPKEELIMDHLMVHQQISYQEIEGLLGIQSISRYLKSLIDNRAIILFEELKEKYKPKMEKRIRLAGHLATEDHVALEALFATLEKKQKQMDVLLKYLQEMPLTELPQLNESGLAKSDLLAKDISQSSMKTLIKNKVLEEFEVVIPRVVFEELSQQQKIELSPAQNDAYQGVMTAFHDTPTVLLHGVTGSGKTEIYISIIQDILSSGGQVLYLLPEIALTTQIIKRLSRYFGDQMGIFHSKYSDNERVEVYQGIIDGRFNFVIGVRSAVFLPFDNLSLIIVDEEHETTYKQFDRSPLFHARDTAVYLSTIHHCKVLLGTATPSIESYHNALNGKYGLIELTERYGNTPLPQIVPVNMTNERKRKKNVGNYSGLLIEGIKNNLSSGEQTIIFQNRRGYAPFLSCDDCGHIPKCPNCSVSLTFHLYQNHLKCHYCGYNESVTGECDFCKSNKVKNMGMGTEKIEEDLQLMFPNATIQRMDLDSTRNKYSYQQIIDDFENGTIDILIGTQMVSKGLDFDSVSKVGIISADRMIHFPDFRSHERAFQLVTQVSGRAGRREKRGIVFLQTNDPAQSIIDKMVRGDYVGFFNTEILEREKYQYPPFYRLIGITVKHKDKPTSWQGAELLSKNLAVELGKSRIKGPSEPLIGKIRNMYLHEIVIRLEKDKIHLGKVKAFIKQKVREVSMEKSLSGIRVVINVDPY
ncbi:MAG: primosomal protein N' [Bacteroidota bacterium]